MGLAGQMSNEVSGEYFSPLVAGTGQRKDIAERAELTHGCVEFVAPGEYAVRAPMPPSFVFVLDASYTAVSSGLLASAAAAVRAWAEAFRGSARTRVALLTYDGAVHFYNLRTARPQMLVVSDLDAVTSGGSAPPAMPDELLVNLADSRDALIGLLEKLPAMFSRTRQVGIALGAACTAAMQACKHIGGRVVAFVSGAPNVGLGTIAQRTTGTDGHDEAAMAQPLTDAAGEFYKNLALDCSRFQIAVDLVVTAAQHAELATLAQLPQITGGEVMHLEGFQAKRDGAALVRNVHGLLTRNIAWEAVIRVRCSKGLRVTAHYGHFFVRSTDLLALPAVDHGKAFAVALQVSEPQQFPGYASIQNALLYTSSAGERRIRVSTISIPLSPNAVDVIGSCDAEAAIGIIAKMAAEKLATVKISDAREAIVRKVVDILCAYRACLGGSVSVTAAGGHQELQLPESLRNLPLYTLGLLKHPALVPGAQEVRPDMRAAAISALRTMPLEHLLIAIHPHLFNLSAMPAEPGELPPLNPLVALSVDPRVLSLFNAGEFLLLHVGREVAPETLFAVFGVSSVRDIQAASLSALPELDNPYSAAVRALIAGLQATREAAGLCAPRLVISTDDRILPALLIADHTRNFFSYHEFVTQLQRNV
jgi:protein transport protein SEC24